MELRVKKYSFLGIAKDSQTAYFCLKFKNKDYEYK